MKKIVLTLELAIGTLLLLGLLMLYSSTTYSLSLARLESQLCWIGLGVGCYWIASRINYLRLGQGPVPGCLIGVTVFLLAAVLLPGVGATRNGAARWLFGFQPSEYAKLALIIFLAAWVARHADRMRERNVGFLLPGGVAALVCLLIFKEPDWGTAALLATVTLAMLFIAGARWSYLTGAVVLSGGLFSLLLARNPLRLERVLVFRDPERYQQKIGWQGWHSLLSLGSGGWLGVFVGNGSQKNGFVPEQQTDFILSLIGEELGFAGALLVLMLFVVVVLCGARIAWKTRDPFGRMLAAGITILIALQVFINIGVVTSSLPNKGIALPFLSYGGSNMLCMMMGAGLLKSVARQESSFFHFFGNEQA